MPEQFDFRRAREMFSCHQPTPGIELRWRKPNEKELTAFLVREKGFAPIRAKNICQKLKRAQEEKAQSRIDAFFNRNQPQQQRVSESLRRRHP
jgi:hypothetical protein